MPPRLRIFYSLLIASLQLIPVVALYSNWDRVRGQHLMPMLIYAAACGGGLVLLLVVATGRLAYRGEREAGATL